MAVQKILRALLAVSAVRAFRAPLRSVARTQTPLRAASVAEWRDACAKTGVVSFYDYGIRLAPPAPPAAPSSKAAYAAREVAKYVAATGAQFGLLLGAASAVDALPFALPAPVVWATFCFLSLRSRVFSLLDNSRPNREGMAGKATPAEVKRPAWTPPGIAFPFIWLTITALRATAATMVYAGALRSAPLEALMLHLCIGDTWNTVTNVEKRLGVSAIGCLAVWGSVLRAVQLFRESAAPAAGLVLAPSLAWISVACVLTANIWLLNGRKPLYPAAADGDSAKTKFAYLLQLEATTIRGGK